MSLFQCAAYMSHVDVVTEILLRERVKLSGGIETSLRGFMHLINTLGSVTQLASNRETQAENCLWQGIDISDPAMAEYS